MKILIGDDHFQVREGVEQIIRTLPDINVIDEVSDGYDLLSKVTQNQYDIVILDICLPGVSGMDILNKMRRLKNKTNVLLYSFDTQSQQAIFALRNGATGFLSNNCVYDEMTKAIRTIRKGEKYISTETA